MLSLPKGDGCPGTTMTLVAIKFILKSTYTAAIAIQHAGIRNDQTLLQAISFRSHSTHIHSTSTFLSSF